MKRNKKLILKNYFFFLQTALLRSFSPLKCCAKITKIAITLKINKARIKFYIPFESSFKMESNYKKRNKNFLWKFQKFVRNKNFTCFFTTKTQIKICAHCANLRKLRSFNSLKSFVLWYQIWNIIEQKQLRYVKKCNERIDFFVKKIEKLWK